jgi:hypothetical protein
MYTHMHKHIYTSETASQEEVVTLIEHLNRDSSVHRIHTTTAAQFEHYYAYIHNVNIVHTHIHKHIHNVNIVHIHIHNHIHKQ